MCVMQLVPMAVALLEAQQRFFSYPYSYRDTCSDSIAKLFRACIYGASIAQVSRDMVQNGVSAYRTNVFV